MEWVIIITACVKLACGQYDVATEGLSVIQPMAWAQAMPLVARWKEEHPGARVVRYELRRDVGA